MNAAEYYNDFYSEMAIMDASGNSFSKIASLVPKLNQARILDIGAGYGSVSQEFLKQGHRVTAIEANQTACKALRDKGFKVLDADLTDPSVYAALEDQDLILLLDVLEHVFNPLELLNMAYSKTRPGGYCIVTVPLYFDLYDRLRIAITGKVVSYDNLCYGTQIYSKLRSYNYDHIRFFRPKEVIELGEKVGFKIIKREYGAMPLPASIPRLIRGLLRHSWLVSRYPGLFAHSIGLLLKK